MDTVCIRKIDDWMNGNQECEIVTWDVIGEQNEFVCKSVCDWSRMIFACIV